MAGDSLTLFGDEESAPASNARSPKIMPLGDVLLGGSGWGVYDDILRDYLAHHPLPILSDEHAIFRFFLDFWKALHDGYPFVNDQASDKDSPWGDLDASFLIAHEHGIFKVSGNLGVTRFNQYWSIGSGSSYALGAMHTLYNRSDCSAEDIARAGVEAGIALSVHSGGEIDVLHWPPAPGSGTPGSGAPESGRTMGHDAQGGSGGAAHG